MSDMGRTTTPGGRAGGAQGSEKSKGAREAESLTQEASEQFDEMKDKARELAERTRGQAAELVGAVKDRAWQALDEQKNTGADRVAGVADAIHNAADELGEQLPFAADYVREAAEGVERFSSTLRDHSIEDLVRGVTTFARQQPVAFFGAAVLAGFVATRFIKASAERHQRQAGGARGYGHEDAVSEYPWESEPPASARGRTYRSAGGETVRRANSGSSSASAKR